MSVPYTICTICLQKSLVVVGNLGHQEAVESLEEVEILELWQL